MSLSTLINRPCVIVRRSESGNTDRYGNDLPTETLVETVCEIQQEERAEDAGGAITETRWRAFFDVDEDLRSDDAVLVDGWEYELVGDPWKADSGSAAVHHVEATLKRSAGVEDVS